MAMTQPHKSVSAPDAKQEGREMVMIVDDDITNIRVGKNALAGVYDVFTIPSAAKMFDLLNRNTPAMILLDIDMPEMDGYTAIKALKADPNTRDIPVIFLTSKNDSGSELEGLSLGAIDYITKPFQPALLRKRIEVHLMVEAQKHKLEAQARILEEQRKKLLDFNNNLQKLVEEKTGKVLELQSTILQTVADLVESRDDITGGHVQRTQEFLRILVDALVDLGLYREQVEEWDIDLLLQSSQLHDVGKISISDMILNKPGKLTQDEFDEIKKHAAFGVKIIEKMEHHSSESDFLKYAKIFAGTHHEKWDGSGYPVGLSGEDIPLQGRLMAIADVYDALVCERPYKKAFPHDEAVEIIAGGRGTHFDPLLVDIFLQVSDQFRRD